MSQFKDTILKILFEYKYALRKQRTSQEWEAKIKSLGIQGKELETLDALALYERAKLLLSDLENELGKGSDETAFWYCGLYEFQQYLQRTLMEYTVFDGNVIHKNQYAASSLLQAIQLVNLPSNNISDRNHQTLDTCLQIVAKFGTLDQKKMLAKGLQKSMQHDASKYRQLFAQYSRETLQAD